MTYIPNVDSLKVAGRTYTGPFIMGQCALVGTGTTGTFVESNGTSGYQVPGGKTLKIIGIRVQPDVTLGNFYIQYSDNDLGYSGTTAPTNSVVVYGSSAYTTSSQVTQYDWMEIPLNFDVPTGKYPGAVAGAFKGNIVMIGYLY